MWGEFNFDFQRSMLYNKTNVLFNSPSKSKQFWLTILLAFLPLEIDVSLVLSLEFLVACCCLFIVIVDLLIISGVCVPIVADVGRLLLLIWLALNVLSRSELRLPYLLDVLFDKELFSCWPSFDWLLDRSRKLSFLIKLLEDRFLVVTFGLLFVEMDRDWEDVKELVDSNLCRWKVQEF